MERRDEDKATYGAGGGAVKGLLALDVDVGAIGSLELDLEVGWLHWLAGERNAQAAAAAGHAGLGVVEVLVDELQQSR